MNEPISRCPKWEGFVTMTPMVPNPSAPGSSPATNQPGNGDALPVLDPSDVPNLDNVVTEDGVPVDSVFAENQYRLLTEPLYNSWPGPGEGRPFVVMTNVGLFATIKQPPLVPDCLLSLDVRVGEDLRKKENHSYFMWIFDKPPDVVIEIVSDKRGGEEDYKKDAYARMRVLFYVIFDPDDLLGGGVLRAYVLNRRKYVVIEPGWFAEVGLGLTLWPGTYEGAADTWLRWCDQDGRVILTGAERAEEADRKAERLAAQVRALGGKPEV